MISLAEAILKLTEMATEVATHSHHGLEEAAKLVCETAKAKLGDYQGASGPYPAWPQLSDATQERRTALGYSPDEPLKASGDLEASLGYGADANTAVVGSNDPNLVRQELGTTSNPQGSPIPPRPFLAPAAYQHGHDVAGLYGASIVAGLTGKRP